MLIFGKDTRRIESLKKALGKSFAMKDLGPAKKILERFNMSDAKPVGSVSPTNFKLNAK